MAVAERLDTEAAEIKGAIEKIAPDDVAFVQEHLAAKITSNTGTGTDGNQRSGTSVFDGAAVALLKMNDGEHAIGTHIITGRIEHQWRDIGARKELHGIDTAGKG